MIFAAGLRAEVTEPASPPYQVILDRNPFGLKTNAPAGPVGPTNPVVPGNVKLTGFSSDSAGKNWKVWLMVLAQPGKNPQYFSLMEHEKQGDIEVLEINEKENTVKILNGGNHVELNVKDNGLPTPTAPVVPGVPLTPHGGPPGTYPAPGIVPAPGTPGIKTAGAQPAGNPAADALAAKYGLQPSSGTATPAYRTIPARNLRTTPVEPQAVVGGGQVDAAVQRIMIEAQKVQAEREGKAFPPLPPLPGPTGR